MEQVKIEQFAFLYLCSEHDKRLLLKKEKMPLADFDRLTYLIYHFGFKEYHIKVWMEFAGEFKKEWDWSATYFVTAFLPSPAIWPSAMCATPPPARATAKTRSRSSSTISRARWP